MAFSLQQTTYLNRVETGWPSLLPAADARPARIHEAMRYALEAGGKRIRPIMVLAAADLFPSPVDALPAAVAVECIHTYSLIHDDLPCMDNDDLRRGRPTCHKAFDEATALLAGDALLTHAFAMIGVNYAATPVLATALLCELGDAAGSRRLIGGQMADILAEKKSSATADELEFIHLNKTAAMLEASLVMGGLCGNAPDAALCDLRLAGRHLGLAFQIIDDILDATSDAATLGKTPGKDAKSDKTTYVKLHGLDESRRLAAIQTDAALAAIRRLPGDTDFLHALTESLLKRAN
jgi:geranylgeranyl diphosphate synthase, type II